MIKKIIFLILFVSTLFANLHSTLKDIANISSVALYNYDEESLSKIVNQYINQNSKIKAIVIYDTINNVPFYSVFRQKGKLIQNQKLPKEFEKLYIIKDNIIYNSNVIGKVIIYADEKLKALCFTQKEIQWIKDHHVIKFVLNSKYSPIEFIDKKGNYAGISKSYLDIISKKTGIIFKPIKIDKNDRLTQIKQNKADMITYATKTPSQEKYLNFSNPYLNYSIVMVTTLDKPFLDNIKALYGKKVVAIKGDIISEFLSNYPQIKLFYVDTIKEALESVASKKAYSFVSLLPIASYNINKYNFFNLKIAGKAKDAFAISIALKKELGQTGIDIINKVLSNITEQEKKMIYNKWVGITFNKRVDYTIIWKISIISFIILSIVLYWNRKLKAQQAELKKMTLKAQIAAKAKSEFISNMSHEIRTPMNAIIGFTEILAKDIKEPTQLAHIKTIQNASNALLILINDILDLSKIEAGKLKIQKSSADIESIITEIKTIFSIEASKKGLDILIDIQKDLPNSLVIDTVRVRQILLNLVGNAIKFTKKGYIKISVYTQKIENKTNKVNLIFSVEDTGKGIPKDQISVIFEAFEQVKDQDIKQFGGTGLGLSISSKLAKMMNGQLNVESQEGKGSIFTLTLFDVEISTDLSKKTTNILNKEIVFDKATILAVDDIEDNNKLIINYFKDTNITIVTASNGIEAIEKFKSNKVDLILMNIKMPIMDGYTAAKEIKKISDVPIIALTASTLNNEDKIFNGYLKKPFTKESLFILISRFLSHKIKDKKDINIEEDINFSLEQIDKSIVDNLAKEIDKTIMPIYKKIEKSNNISAIKTFIKNLEQISKKYNIVSLQKYTKKLNDAIKIFDIIQIETLLSKFKNFIEIINGNLK